MKAHVVLGSFEGTVKLDNGVAMRANVSHTVTFTKLSEARLPNGAKDLVRAAFKQVDDARMQVIRNAMDSHGYCSAEHYAAIDSVKAFEMTVEV